MPRTLSSLLIFCSILIFSLNPAIAQWSPITIPPVPGSLQGKAVEVRASFQDSDQNRSVLNALLWYKNSDDLEYTYSDMLFINNEFRGSIPSEDVRFPSVEYFIEFQMRDGTSVTSPVADPRNTPYQIPVKMSGGETAPIIKSSGPSPIIVINPSEDEIVTSEEILIAASIQQPIRELNPEKVRIRIDGVNYTPQAQISEVAIVLTVKGLAIGRHRVDILYFNQNSYEYLKTWFFSLQEDITLGAVPFAPTELDLSGQVELSGSYQNINEISNQVGRANIQADHDNGLGIYTSLRIRLSSEERYDLQPQNRYQVSVRGANWKVTLGDVNPRFNEFMVWGKRIRGVNLDYRLGKYSFSGVYGELNRGIEGKLLSRIETVDNTDPAHPDTLIDSTFVPGTYKQWMWAVRFGFQPGRDLKAEWITMKSMDDRTSIVYGKRPKDNFVTGLNLEWRLDRRRLAIISQSALSLYNDNINDPVMEQYRDIRDLVWINLNFDPLPADTSRNYGKLISSALSRSLSTRTRLQLNYFNHDAQFGFLRLGSSYHSLGNPSMITDRQGFFVRDRVRLMRDRLTVFGNYQSLKDNLLDKDDYTTSIDEYSIGFNFFPSVHLPTFSGSYRYRKTDNHAELQTIVEGDETVGLDTTIIDNRKKNESSFFTGSISHSFVLINLQNDFAASYSYAERKTYNDPFGAFNQNTINTTIRTRYNFPLQSTFGFMKSSQSGAISSIDYNTIQARGDYSFFNRTLNAFFGANVTLGDGTNTVSPISPGEMLEQSGLDLDLPEVQAMLDSLNLITPEKLLLDFTKIDWIGGMNLDFLENHRIRLYFSFTSFFDHSKYQYFNGASFSIDEEVVVNSSLDRTLTFQQPVSSTKRNNVLLMLSYIRRF